jgi:MYXO-CTERM domain-containing protein
VTPRLRRSSSRFTPWALRGAVAAILNLIDTLTGVAFTDTLPPGLVVATPNGLTGSCGSSVTATAGSSSISLSGGMIPAGASCLFVVNVTGTTVGDKLNTTGTVTSSEGGDGNAASASLTVTAPPTSTPTRTPTTTPTPTPGACILGDINCDGLVDIRDYGLWRQSFGATNCGNPADLDGNCIVDIRDYGIWRANFGHTAGGAPPGSAAPAVAPTGTASPAPTRTPRPASTVPGRSAEGDRGSAGDPPAAPPELLAGGALVAGLFWRVRRRHGDE